MKGRRGKQSEEKEGRKEVQHQFEKVVLIVMMIRKGKERQERENGC